MIGMFFYTAFIAVAFLYQSVKKSKTVTHRTLELPTTINKEPKLSIKFVLTFFSCTVGYFDFME